MSALRLPGLDHVQYQIQREKCWQIVLRAVTSVPLGVQKGRVGGGGRGPQ